MIKAGQYWACEDGVIRRIKSVGDIAETEDGEEYERFPDYSGWMHQWDDRMELVRRVYVIETDPADLQAQLDKANAVIAFQAAQIDAANALAEARRVGMAKLQEQFEEAIALRNDANGQIAALRESLGTAIEMMPDVPDERATHTENCVWSANMRQFQSVIDDTAAAAQAHEDRVWNAAIDEAANRINETQNPTHLQLDNARQNALTVAKIHLRQNVEALKRERGQ